MAERHNETVPADHRRDDDRAADREPLQPAVDDQGHVDRVVRAAALADRDGRGTRPSRREVGEVVDGVVPFAELGSLTDRARLREQVMTRLTEAQRRQRGRRGWSL